MKQLLARTENQFTLIDEGDLTHFEACVAEAERILASDEKLSVTETMGADANFWFPADDYRSRFRPYLVKDGILSIPVKGALLNDFPWQFGGWATGYTYIREALRRGLGDTDVRGIVFAIHSPGGVVAGNFDLVDWIYEQRGTKPMRAIAADMACSAAYSIASAADDISITRSGSVGSIGILHTHTDLSGALEQRGVKITYTYKGKRKVDGNSTEPLSSEALKRIEARVDALYSEFVGIVARNRGMDEKAVSGTESLVYDAKEALAVGLADQIGTFDDEITAFSGLITQNEEDEEMAEKQAQTFTQEDLDAAKTKAFADGQKQGATDAVARINEIVGSDAGKLRPKAAMNAAMKTSMAADEAIAFIGELPEEKAEAPTEEPKGAGGQEEPKGAGAPKGMLDAAMEKTEPGAVTPGSGNEDPKSQAEQDAELFGAFGLPGFKESN